MSNINEKFLIVALVEGQPVEWQGVAYGDQSRDDMLEDATVRYAKGDMFAMVAAIPLAECRIAKSD